MESVREVECKSGGLVALNGGVRDRESSDGFSDLGGDECEIGAAFGGSLFSLCSGVE